MYGEDAPDGSAADLASAFARASEAKSLSPAEQAFVEQAAADVRPDELAGLEPADLAELLAGFWRFADRRDGDAPMLRLAHAHGADARDLKLDLLQIVQDDAPFLVDSVMGTLSAAGFDVRAMFHPVVQVGRGADGARDPAAPGRPESMIMVVLGEVGEDRRAGLLESVEMTLKEVRLAVDDFDAMGGLMARTIAELDATDADFPPYGKAEYLDFLRWITAERFVFLGARIYTYPRTAGGGYAPEEPDFGPHDCLGVLRDPARSVLRRTSEPTVLSAHASEIGSGPPVTVAKSNLRSVVHRRSYMDYVGVRRYGADGRPSGEVRFVGLFTHEAYEESPRSIPLLRAKVERVIAAAGENPSEHTVRMLRLILEDYPRDELFQASEDELLRTALGILHLYDRPRVRLFTRRDRFERFVSALLFIPRERYGSDVLQRAGRILADGFGGRVSAFYPTFSDQPLARVHYIIGLDPGRRAEPDERVLEAEIAEAVRTWSDRFEAAVRGGGVAPGLVAEVLARYDGAFPAGYRDQYDAAEALADLEVMEGSSDQPLRIRAYRRTSDTKTQFRFKLYHDGRAVPLADVLPLLENMGLKAMAEEGFPIARNHADGARQVTWIHEFLLEDERGERLKFSDIQAPFEDTFLAAWTGLTENDGFNRLVLELGAPWREVALLRAFARYRQQSGLDPSQPVQEAALTDHPEIGRLILDLFRIKFDPALHAGAEDRQPQAKAVEAEITAALQAVESLDHDRVLRRLALLVAATVRTNFYQTDEEGGSKPYISFKIASAELEHLPAPKPYREIFVWAPHVEGVHLRFGPVARGGLRWSDRRDDFRTEILGLVKAQNVKNAVIVPVGSKGGFYPKRLPRGGSPDAVRAEGVRAYTTFLDGLLDITDNLDAKGKVIRPEAVIAHDGDDPYLVVAADKGTATFSDIANGIAEDYGFWLGDAFASGGSAGYDHKAMGITARGAWEAVKRHFRELGKDIQAEPFTCVGIGDMSGDVFGNGALLSKQMKLVAAFDHRHVFLDPDPDPERSWTERKRLFELPRSSWDDYDKALISKGGGVFPRTAKEIAVTDEVKALLEIEEGALAPSDLIRAILKAPVELLYLGGIGTYVKGPGESDAEVGDKANDAVRVEGPELRCQVVGEGANLGFTQAGRISYARLGNGGQGGRIDTDAIDNSAGVDTSDHEVNIKILLGQAERNGDLERKDRDALLASMTDEVAAHVLKHNYDQTLGLSLQESDAPAELDAQATFISDLEVVGRLDRRVEGLPRGAAIAELRAAGRGLTRPEIAVLTAYGKLELSAALVQSRAPDDPYFEKVLVGYFPKALARFEAEMRAHRLRREIIATVLANEIVDMVGPTFASRLMSGLGCDAAALAAAFETARQAFRLDEAWTAVNALDGRIPTSAQIALYREIARALRGQTYWLARRAVAAKDDVRALIDAYRPTADALQSAGGELLSPFEREAAEARRAGFIEAGAPEALARTVAGLRPLTGASDIADLAKAADWQVEAATRLYFALGTTLSLDRLRTAASALQPEDGFERAALRSLIIELLNEQARFTRDAAAAAKAGGEPDAAIEAWTDAHRTAVERVRKTIDEIEQSAGGWTFAKLTIANAALREIGA